MKFLKYFLLLILVVIVAGAVYFGAQDGKFDVAATKDLKVPQQLAFQTADDFQTWDKWGPWMKLDPDVAMTYGDTLQGVGANYSWSSEHPGVGDGSMKTIAITDNESIDQKITFNSPMGDSESDVYWRFEPGPDNTTRVTWGMKGEMGLMEKVFMAFQSEPFEESIKSMYEEGLANMETHIMDQMKSHNVNFDGIVEYGGGYYLYMTASSDKAGLASKMGPISGKIGAYLHSNGLTPSGMPFTTYHQVDEQTGQMIFSSAMPIKERVITAAGSEVLCGYIPPLTAVKTTLKGNYDYLENAYNNALDYIQEKALTIDPEQPKFEIYSNDPGMFPNPADWITEVYIPIVPPTETIN